MRIGDGKRQARAASWVRIAEDEGKRAAVDRRETEQCSGAD
jgi:hypothetical protein